MQKKLIGLMTLCLLSTTAFANDDIAITGFTITKNNPVAMELKFRDQLKLTISKKRFNNQKSAEAFCLSQKSKLDQDFSVLLIAMSGAANFNSFLNSAITFKVTKGSETRSGIWSWTGKDNKIKVMLDGGGTQTDDLSPEELATILKVELPAICSQVI